MFFVNHIYLEAVFLLWVCRPCLDVHIATNYVSAAARHEVRYICVFYSVCDCYVYKAIVLPLRNEWSCYCFESNLKCTLWPQYH